MDGRSSIPCDVWDRVERRLDDIERSYEITILHAVESGSRAWGFPSPDSDYDVRFIYRHTAAWYVSLFEERDVVEEGVDELGMDVSGWDVRKALRLLLKSNPVLYEWLVSPIVYRSGHGWAGDARMLCERLFDRTTLGLHYRNVALNHRKAYWRSRDEVGLKKYFYVIRPLCAITWLRTHPALIPPMNLQHLMAEINLPEEVRIAIENLLHLKRRTSEMGTAMPIPALECWIEAELANDTELSNIHARSETAHHEVDDFYSDTIGFARSSVGRNP